MGMLLVSDSDKMCEGFCVIQIRQKYLSFMDKVEACMIPNQRLVYYGRCYYGFRYMKGPCSRYNPRSTWTV